MEKKVGLFITRAQPGIHAGQADGIEQAREQGITDVVIGIGSANKEYTMDNPFTYEERKEMVEISAKELFSDLNVQVVPVPDFEDSERWRNYLAQHLPPFGYVISGNERVNEVFKNTDKKIIPLKVRKYVKGSALRKQIAMNRWGEASKVLPAGVIDYLQTIGADKRLTEISHQEREGPSVTADIVYVDDEGYLILVDRKYYPTGHALPGGFVDLGESTKNAAIREMKEETGLDVEITEFVALRDDPDRDPRDHNIAAVYRAKKIGGELQAADDAKQIIKIPFTKEAITNHEPFAFEDHRQTLLEYLEKLENMK
ncbi:MAG: NUDIX domain-containing protein [Candidatus Absconditabacteria bacterium]